MGISINVQHIKQARARKISPRFSTVDLTTQRALEDTFFDDEVSLFIEGPGHEDAAARIAALINEQVVRRDAPKHTPLPYENSATIPQDDGPTYDGPDDEQEAGRLEMEQGVSLGQAREAAEEQRAYEEEDRLAEEKHLRSVRRDDKPWTPHEDEIERDVAEGRRDADGEPVS